MFARTQKYNVHGIHPCYLSKLKKGIIVVKTTYTYHLSCLHKFNYQQIYWLMSMHLCSTYILNFFRCSTKYRNTY